MADKRSPLKDRPLRELLGESTGRTFEVRSVIVYPGWYVGEGNAKQGVVWVLAPKRLPVFLDHRKPRRFWRKHSAHVIPFKSFCAHCSAIG